MSSPAPGRDLVVALAADDDVLSRLRADLVDAARAVDLVGARARFDDVVSRAPGQPVPAGRAGQPISAASPIDVLDRGQPVAFAGLPVGHRVAEVDDHGDRATCVADGVLAGAAVERIRIHAAADAVTVAEDVVAAEAGEDVCGAALSGQHVGPV